MGLKEQLMQDYKDAMKNADTVKKNTVNMVRAAIKQHEVGILAHLDASLLLLHAHTRCRGKREQHRSGRQVNTVF